MRLTTTCFAAVIAAGVLAGPAAAQSQVTVPFSDTSRPGTVVIRTLNSSITVKAAARRDVLIEAHSQDDDRNRNSRGNDRTNGLRRLGSNGGFTAIEENNQIVINTGLNGDSELLVTVPTRTNLKVTGNNGDGITIDGVEGDIEVHHLNGDVTLTNVAGAVSASTQNGNLKASLTRVTPDKPMAFSSFNGDVDVTLPSSLKATFKLRADRGDVYTDFDLKIVTATPAPQGTRRNGQYRIEVNKSIAGTLNGGGPEFDLHTFNGNVYLRRGGQ